jgi:hypothetical protein
MDGDLDLFVTSLSIIGTYGITPENILLENDGKGNFRNIIDSKAPGTKLVGMSTDAVWQDIDGDNIKDLVIVGEWMSPKIFKNNGTALEEYKTNLDEYSGMFNTVEIKDFNNDGKMDLILGNRGLNAPYKADKEHPSKMFINDFDNNGTIEQIITQTINNRDVPIHLKRELTGQISSLKKQNLKFSEYAKKSSDELFMKEIFKAATVKTINTFANLIAYNKGNGIFKVEELPRETQLSCICSITCEDINKDGYVDVILGGNNFNLKPQFSRLDANRGLVLFGNKNGNFTNQKQTGFDIEGEIKEMKWFKDREGNQYVLVGVNNQQPIVLKLK